jgi:hypothetical protein
LPQLLLSSHNLVSLSLTYHDVFLVDGVFLSPEALTAALSATTQLKSLSVRPRYNKSFHVQRGFHASSPDLFPVLKAFDFAGSGEYLEDLVSRIDAHLLEQISVYLYRPHSADVPQLSQFIKRAEQLSALPHLSSI